MPFFFVDSNQLSGETLEIRGPLAKHLAGALRMRSGDRLFVVDERKKGYSVSLKELNRSRIFAQILERHAPPPPPPLTVTVAQSILKGKKMDWVLQKVTELGASRIIPITTQRTVIEPRIERAEGRHRRWAEILKEAAQQSERWDIPQLDYPAEAGHVMALAEQFDLAIIAWEGKARSERTGGVRKILRGRHLPVKALIMIGPEGGFTADEIETARRHGCVAVGLGPRILRSETACLAALLMLQYELGDMGYAE